MMVCCVFSLESRHRGDFYKCIPDTIMNLKIKSSAINPYTILSSALRLFLLGTQEQVQNSHDNEPTEVLL